MARGFEALAGRVSDSRYTGSEMGRAVLKPNDDSRR